MREVLNPAVSILLALTLMAGCSTVPLPSSSSSSASRMEVPKLILVVDCKDCEVPDDALFLISESYQAAASASGATMARNAEATLTITEYSIRNLAFLMLAGPLAMAMTDEIKGTISFDGKMYPVEKASRNPIPFSRKESLAKSIGYLTFSTLSR